MLGRLADLFILEPSRQPIPAPDKARHTLRFGAGHLEVWQQGAGVDGSEEPDAFVLKLPGAGGRAERATEHPSEAWTSWSIQIWSLNPPGYGGSDGRASVQTLASACRTVMEEMLHRADGRPIVLTGNSLGTASALFLAAHYPVVGLILRNPPPLRQLIQGRFGWWNLGIGARLIARQVPDELDSIANASRVRAPAVVISSQRDRIVPPRYQQQVIDAYGGEHRLVRLLEADHTTPPTSDEMLEYARELEWLAQQSFARGAEKASSRTT